MNELQQLCMKIANELLYTLTLDGYFRIDYYTGDITIHGVLLPDGLCLCSRYKNNDYIQFDMNFNEFSDYTQKMILLEVNDKYCK